MLRKLRTKNSKTPKSIPEYSSCLVIPRRVRIPKITKTIPSKMIIGKELNERKIAEITASIAAVIK
jgi:hypothetical protein